jgi:hypothetical protein
MIENYNLKVFQEEGLGCVTLLKTVLNRMAFSGMNFMHSSTQTRPKTSFRQWKPVWASVLCPASHLIKH